jgi:hypothetical protein
MPVMVGGQEAAVSYPGLIGWSADANRIFFTEEGGCGQGGCTPGFLYMADLASDAPPRKLYEKRINEIVSPRPD